MTKYSEIRKYIQEIVGDMRNLPIPATVKEVQEDTCTVELHDGFELTDVKIRATIGEEQYLKLIPKVGSKVLLLSLSGDLDNLTVIKIDQVAKIEYSQDGLQIIADSEDQKVKVENETCGLLEIMEDFTSILKGLKVYTIGGASGVPIQTTQVAIGELETKFKSLLK